MIDVILSATAVNKVHSNVHLKISEESQVNANERRRKDDVHTYQKYYH
jgi:hypothetical protein